MIAKYTANFKTEKCKTETGKMQKQFMIAKYTATIQNRKM